MPAAQSRFRVFAVLSAAGTLLVATAFAGIETWQSIRGGELTENVVTDIPVEPALPAREAWEAFARRLEQVRATGSLAELGACELEARALLLLLRALPDYEDYADWLSSRVDEIVVAKQTAPTGAPLVWFSPITSATPQTARPDLRDAAGTVPLLDAWTSVLRDQPRSRRADVFLPDLKRIFIEEGVPAALAWIPEVESSFNPRAYNPSGARGLFQLMPLTAQEQGLKLWPHDERIHPQKSARAAARLLRRLHERFDSWPLALAAYNAGEGRVRRTLKAADATTFADIADALPNETRLYVPRVLATLAVREGIAPSSLAAPSN